MAYNQAKIYAIIWRKRRVYTNAPIYYQHGRLQGVWICDNVAEVSGIQFNAVCLGSGVDYDAIAKCRPFFELFEYVVIVTPNAIAREKLVREIFPRLPACVVYVINDSGFKNCKTVTAINLADILVREHHKRVVLADCDGQMNLTRFFFPEFDPTNSVTVAEVLTGEHKPWWCDNLACIREGLDLLPGSPALYDLDLLAILHGLGNTYALKGFCEEAAFDGKTDYFILDCPPGYTLTSVSALTAADEVIIPLQIDGFSIAGMLNVREQLSSLKEPAPDIAGVLVTQWHNSEVVRQGEALVREMGIPVFKTAIRRTDKVPESTFDLQPITSYSPGSAAAQDYRRWVREYLGEVL